MKQDIHVERIYDRKMRLSTYPCLMCWHRLYLLPFRLKLFVYLLVYPCAYKRKRFIVFICLCQAMNFPFTFQTAVFWSKYKAITVFMTNLKFFEQKPMLLLNFLIMDLVIFWKFLPRAKYAQNTFIFLACVSTNYSI